jgi:hypothetical protein
MVRIGGAMINSQVVNVGFVAQGFMPIFSEVNLVAGNTYTFRIQASYPIELAIVSSTYSTYYNDTQDEPFYRLGFKTHMYQPLMQCSGTMAEHQFQTYSLTYQASFPGSIGVRL